MSAQPSYTQFLLQLADLGCQLRNQSLQEGARAVLKLAPADRHTVDRLRAVSQENAVGSSSSATAGAKKAVSQIWEGVFFTPSPSQTLYNLEVTYSLLMPGVTTLLDKTFEFQLAFCRARGIPAIISMLTKNNFLSKVVECGVLEHKERELLLSSCYYSCFCRRI